MLTFEEIEDCFPGGKSTIHGPILDGHLIVSSSWLHYFATAVAAKEREACAKVCEARMERHEHEYREDIEAQECAAAIRMRSNV